MFSAEQFSYLTDIFPHWPSYPKVICSLSLLSQAEQEGVQSGGDLHEQELSHTHGEEVRRLANGLYGPWSRLARLIRGGVTRWWNLTIYTLWFMAQQLCGEKIMSSANHS